ncbi:MAG: hypothetical protein OXI01_11100 [Albidovulum sp.]|nr:hypothetical protein [Albidovulum sp.]
MSALLESIAEAVPHPENLLLAICYLLGLVFVLKSIVRAARRSELGIQSGSWASPIAGLIVGAAFLAFPTAVTVGLETLFGSGTVSDPSAIFAYSDIISGQSYEPNFGSAVESFALIARLLGYIAFARGLYLLNAATVDGSAAAFGPGATFVVAGIAAVNFPELFRLISNLISG